MFVLDTNVLSELMLAAPDPRASAWADGEPGQTLYTTAISESEIRVGIALMPEGRRRRELAATAERLFEELLAGHVLPFDRRAAHAYAAIGATRRAAGREYHTRDCQIAAIARANGAAVATRNVRDFRDCGIEIVNPWEG
ncbi:MAG: type II toxin-antitoxin system VapC family toxin [Chloroflexota bacterium]|nr:type II toxin-antitoxin system VapC family toxin [Chloroflexota bacterium]MDE2885863.1 type II toxin-antitoxin system VapC family toxin [Chloroflexota bacterium]